MWQVEWGQLCIAWPFSAGGLGVGSGVRIWDSIPEAFDNMALSLPKQTDFEVWFTAVSNQQQNSLHPELTTANLLPASSSLLADCHSSFTLLMSQKSELHAEESKIIIKDLKTFLKRDQKWEVYRSKSAWVLTTLDRTVGTPVYNQPQLQWRWWHVPKVTRLHVSLSLAVCERCTRWFAHACLSELNEAFQALPIALPSFLFLFIL